MRLSNRKNIRFFSFVSFLAVCIAVVSLLGNYSALGASKVVTANNSTAVTSTADKTSTAANSTNSNTAVNDQNLPLKDILAEKGISPSAKIDIVVSKGTHTLSLYSNGVFLKSYHVELGEGGSGDKQVTGDKKTPEGSFYITEKTVYNPADYYLGTRWMELSYPNTAAAERGLRDGIIDLQTYDDIVNAINNGETPPQDTALGGYIGIHGGGIPAFGKDWTWGCVGLANKDVQDFYGYVGVGTSVTIEK